MGDTLMGIVVICSVVECSPVAPLWVLALSAI
jgi:hypothetical protein